LAEESPGRLRKQGNRGKRGKKIGPGGDYGGREENLDWSWGKRYWGGYQLSSSAKTSLKRGPEGGEAGLEIVTGRRWWGRNWEGKPGWGPLLERGRKSIKGKGIKSGENGLAAGLCLRTSVKKRAQGKKKATRKRKRLACKGKGEKRQNCKILAFPVAT